METIICSCGNDIGRLITIYDIAWYHIKKETTMNQSISIDMLPLSETNIGAGKLLDCLGIHLECCRTTMLSKIKVSSLR